MSGSDLQQIVNEAALLAVRECYDDDDHNHSTTTATAASAATNTTRSGRRNIEEPDRTTNHTDSDNHVVTQQHLENAIRRHRQRSGQVQK
jgi:SpoVK/Ycf46/Vps4 family AAA+-type ATPase